MQRKVIIEGHTDSLGSSTLNKELSEKRAEAVAEYLTADKTMEQESVEAHGYGYERPLSSNKTAKGRAENRRVDIIVTPSRVE